MQRSRSNLGSNSSSVALELDSPVISLLNDNWLDSKHKGEIKTLKGTHSETKAHDVMPLKGSRVKPEHMKVQLQLETDLTWRVIAVFCFKTRPVRESVCVCVCEWETKSAGIRWQPQVSFLPSMKSTNATQPEESYEMEMSLKVQLMNAQKQPSNIKREICKAIEVSFIQLFLIRSDSWDQPSRYVPPERLCFYKQSLLWLLSWLGPRAGPPRSLLP